MQRDSHQSGAGRRGLLRWLALATVLGLLLTACGSKPATGGNGAPAGSGQTKPASDEAPNKNNTIVFGRRVMEKTNPVLDMDLDRVPLWVFDGLVDFTADLKATGALAETWDVSNGGKTYVFHLRHNVTWHDGKPFTADDVVFTAQVSLDPKNKSYMAPYFQVNGKPIQVTKMDDYTVKFDLPEPSNAFLFNMWRQNTVIVPKHLLEGQDMQTTAFNLNPVGTGPYQVIKYVPKQQVILKANPNYWGGAPKVPYWIFKEMEDQNAGLAALGSGDVTAIGVGGKSAQEAAAKIPGVKVYGADSGWILGMVFNVRRAPVSEKAVRQAVAYAIDREQMVKTIAGPDVTTAWSVVGWPGTWQYDDNVKKYKQDVEKAKTLLDQAGWKPGPDGIRVKDGKPLTFDVIIQAKATDSDPLPFAVAIQKAVQDIGIKMTITQLDRASLQPRLLKEHNFDAFIWWDGYSFVPDLSAYWVTASNPNGYATPELDQMIATANTTPDQTLRKQTLDKIAEQVAEDCPIIPLYYYRSHTAIQSWVQNVPKPSAADPNNTGIFYNVQNLAIAPH